VTLDHKLDSSRTTHWYIGPHADAITACSQVLLSCLPSWMPLLQVIRTSPHLPLAS